MDARVSVGGCLLLIGAIGVTAAVRHDWSNPSSGTAASGDEPVVLRLFKDPVPVGALTLQTIDGRTLATSEWKGKITLVNFWATWCPPCRAEIPDLIALQARSGDRLQIVGVSEDHDAVDAVRAFVAEHKVNYPIVMATAEIERAFSGVAGLPTTFVVTRTARLFRSTSACWTSRPLSAKRRRSPESCRRPSNAWNRTGQSGSRMPPKRKRFPA